MKINMQVQTKHFIKQLGKKGNQLQITAANTLNESAEEIQENYRGNLKKSAKLRNKFSLNSVGFFKANPISKSGTPRPLHKINAIIGIKKMKGKDHYLTKAEEGGTTRGTGKTRSKVPIPLASGRTSMSINKPVAGANRLNKAVTQTLKINGKPFGIHGDRNQRTNRPFTVRQRFAILHTYQSKLKGNSSKISGDLSKPFYFIDNKNQLAIFKFKGKNLQKIRTLSKSSVKRKPRPRFKNAVGQMTPNRIQQKFIKNAERVIK